MSTASWKFFRAGGVDQVNLSTGEDLIALGELDQKLWVALACPVDGLEFEARTLELIDTDGDRRVKALELIAAVKWVGALLSDLRGLAAGSPELPLAAINRQKDEGAAIHATATALLQRIGKASAPALAVADVAAAIDAFNKQPNNGDGVIPAAAAGEDDLAAAIRDALACVAAPAVDRGGEPGLDQALLDGFFGELAAFVGWRDAGQGAEVRFLGADSEAAYAAWSAVAAKVDDYFSRAAVAGFDARALAALNRDAADYAAIAAGLMSADGEALRPFPLAQVEAGRPLPLRQGLNPAWAAEIAALRDQVVAPLLGEREALSAADWAAIQGRLAPHGAWRAAKAGASVEGLGEERARALLAGDYRARIAALIARDLEAAPQATALQQVEKLALFHRDLMRLANNFVSFRDFYGRKGPAIFQAGTLYIDRRACDLCIPVRDAGKHASLAPLSNAFLLYCDLRNGKGEKRSVVAAMTDGDTDNLMVGRNGVFYDREGRDWDATVTRVVDNPISVSAAFWAPYKKLLRLIEGMINSRASAASAAADSRVSGAGAQIESASAGKPAAPEAPKKLDVGVVAAIGVAVGGLTAAFGALIGAFFGLGVWMPVGLAAALLLISGPSMAIAWLKLRQRNLGPLLEANGWAVNALTRVNVPLGRSFTTVATLPEGAQRDLADPFAEKQKPLWLWALLAIVILLGGSWVLGSLDGLLPPAARSVTVLGEAAPAAVVVPPAEAPAEAPAGAPAAE